jgi:hypothetical protein
MPRWQADDLALVFSPLVPKALVLTCEREKNPFNNPDTEPANPEMKP